MNCLLLTENKKNGHVNETGGLVTENRVTVTGLDVESSRPLMTIVILEEGEDRERQCDGCLQYSLMLRYGVAEQPYIILRRLTSLPSITGPFEVLLA